MRLRTNIFVRGYKCEVRTQLLVNETQKKALWTLLPCANLISLTTFKVCMCLFKRFHALPAECLLQASVFVLEQPVFLRRAEPSEYTAADRCWAAPAGHHKGAPMSTRHYLQLKVCRLSGLHSERLCYNLYNQTSSLSEILTGICWISPVLVMICCMTCIVCPAGCAACAWACPCAAACTICTCWPSPTCMVTGALWKRKDESHEGGAAALNVHTSCVSSCHVPYEYPETDELALALQLTPNTALWAGKASKRKWNWSRVEERGETQDWPRASCVKWRNCGGVTDDLSSSGTDTR